MDGFHVRHDFGGPLRRSRDRSPQPGAQGRAIAPKSNNISSGAAALASSAIGAAASSSAAETITYTYDAKGRLVKVVRTGTVNNNVTVDYEHDKADNRTRLKVTNSLNPPP
jgi:hypothetical protein